MAYHTPDHEYLKGMKDLEELKGPEGDSIRYYISVREKFHKNREAEFTKLTDALRVVKSFTP